MTAACVVGRLQNSQQNHHGLSRTSDFSAAPCTRSREQARSTEWQVAGDRDGRRAISRIGIPSARRNRRGWVSFPASSRCKTCSCTGCCSVSPTLAESVGVQPMRQRLRISPKVSTHCRCWSVRSSGSSKPGGSGAGANPCGQPDLKCHPRIRAAGDARIHRPPRTARRDDPNGDQFDRRSRRHAPGRRMLPGCRDRSARVPGTKRITPRGRVTRAVFRPRAQ
jgi:hypothetical protein